MFDSKCQISVIRWCFQVLKLKYCMKKPAGKPLRLVFTSDGVVVAVVIRSVERYDFRALRLDDSSASASDSDNPVFTGS